MNLWIQQAAYSKPQATSLNEAIQAWHAGKDFKIVPEGPYYSIRDSAEMLQQGHTAVTILWKREHRAVSLQSTQP